MPNTLLDVNVFVALGWSNHKHHAKVRSWFGLIRAGGWRTCGVTQSGFLRLSLNPLVVDHQFSTKMAIETLGKLTADPDHKYLEALPAPCAPEFREILYRVEGHRQVSDAYLLCIAKHHQVSLATLDQSIKSLSPWPEMVEVII